MWAEVVVIIALVASGLVCLGLCLLAAYGIAVARATAPLEGETKWIWIFIGIGVALLALAGFLAFT